MYIYICWGTVPSFRCCRSCQLPPNMLSWVSIGSLSPMPGCIDILRTFFRTKSFFSSSWTQFKSMAEFVSCRAHQCDQLPLTLRTASQLKLLRLFGISAVPHKTMTLLELGFLESGNAISRSFPIVLIKILGLGHSFWWLLSKKSPSPRLLDNKWPMMVQSSWTLKILKMYILKINVNPGLINHGLWKLGGTPQIVIIWYFFMVSPQLNNLGVY